MYKYQYVYWYIKHVDEGPVCSTGMGIETPATSLLMKEHAWRQINFTSLESARTYRKAMLQLHTEEYRKEFEIVRVQRALKLGAREVIEK